MPDINELRIADIETAREIISKMASLGYGDDSDYEDNLRLIAGAIAAEREACAKIAEGEKVNAEETGAESDEAYNAACEHIAAAIRARGKT